MNTDFRVQSIEEGRYLKAALHYLARWRRTRPDHRHHTYGIEHHRAEAIWIHAQDLASALRRA